MKRAFLIPFLALAGCSDETVTGYGAAGRVWHLHSIGGRDFPETATIGFPERGRIAGQAPCNRFSARVNVPYPWFEISDLATTKRACPGLAAEGDFLSTLAEMTQSEVSGSVLILRNDRGREMVFRSGG